MAATGRPFALLASVRRSLRSLNEAIESACREAGLTMQQQAFLLALAGRDEPHVPLADVRTELAMDQATASELLARLGRMGLVRRRQSADRRAVDCALTAQGRARLIASIEHTREHIQHADRVGELRALRESLQRYLDYYTGVTAARARPRAPRRGAARGSGGRAGPARRGGA